MQAVNRIERDLTLGALKQRIRESLKDTPGATGGLEAVMDRNEQGMPLAGVFMALNPPCLLAESTQVMLRLFYPKPESPHKLRVDDSATLGMILDWLKETEIPYIYSGDGEWFMAYTINPFTAESLMATFVAVNGKTLKEEEQP